MWKQPLIKTSICSAQHDSFSETAFFLHDMWDQPGYRLYKISLTMVRCIKYIINWLKFLNMQQNQPWKASLTIPRDIFPKHNGSQYTKYYVLAHQYLIIKKGPIKISKKEKRSTMWKVLLLISIIICSHPLDFQYHNMSHVYFTLSVYQLMRILR